MEIASVHRIACVLLLAIAALPLILLPGMSLDADSQKGIMAAAFTGIALCFAGIAFVVSSKKISYAPTLLLLSGVPLVLVSLASALFSRTALPTLYAGASFEVTTGGSFVLFACVLASFALIPKSFIRYILGISVCSVLLFGVISGVMYVRAGSDSYAAPSGRVSELIVASSYLESLKQSLLGTGRPYAFSWYRYQPLEVNSSPFWSVEPKGPSSTVLAIAIRWGLFGILALLLLPLAIMFSAVYALRSGRMSVESALAHIFAGGLFVSLCVYDVDVAVFLALACALGCAVRSSLPESPAVFSRKVIIGLGILCVVVGGTCALISVRQFFGAEFQARALEDSRFLPETKVQYLELAYRAWPTEKNGKEASKAVYEEEFLRIEQNEQNRDALLNALQRSTDYINTASGADSRDFEVWIYGASLYVSLIPLGFPDADTKATNFLAHAQRLGPKRPEPHLLLALQAGHGGRIREAQGHLERALALKPDYEEAHALKQKLSNIPSPSIDQSAEPLDSSPSI